MTSFLKRSKKVGKTLGMAFTSVLVLKGWALILLALVSGPRLLIDLADPLPGSNPHQQILNFACFPFHLPRHSTDNYRLDSASSNNASSPTYSAQQKDLSDRRTTPGATPWQDEFQQEPSQLSKEQRLLTESRSDFDTLAFYEFTTSNTPKNGYSSYVRKGHLPILSLSPDIYSDHKGILTVKGFQ